MSLPESPTSRSLHHLHTTAPPQLVGYTGLEAVRLLRRCSPEIFSPPTIKASKAQTRGAYESLPFDFFHAHTLSLNVRRVANKRKAQKHGNICACVCGFPPVHLYRDASAPPSVSRSAPWVYLSVFLAQARSSVRGFCPVSRWISCSIRLQKPSWSSG